MLPLPESPALLQRLRADMRLQHGASAQHAPHQALAPDHPQAASAPPAGHTFRALAA